MYGCQLVTLVQNASIAQLAEHPVLTRKVLGSIPSGGSMDSLKLTRSNTLNIDECLAIMGDKMPEIRLGPEWKSCPDCMGGMVQMNLGPVLIQGRCLLCCGTGRVLINDIEVP